MPMHLFLGSVLASAQLLGFQVLVEKIEGTFVGRRRAHDGEHALSSLVVWGLGELVMILCDFFKVYVTFAMEMRAPEDLRISLILLPPRPMIHPTMSAGMLMFWV